MRLCPLKSFPRLEGIRVHHEDSRQTPDLKSVNMKYHGRKQCFTVLTATEESLSDEQSHVPGQGLAEVGDERSHLAALADGGAEATLTRGQVTRGQGLGGGNKYQN